MIDGGREVASGDSERAAGDPDARWRPSGRASGRTAVADPDSNELWSNSRVDESPAGAKAPDVEAADVARGQRGVALVHDSEPRRARNRRRADRQRMSPWSRESIEAPLPTIEQIRRRWRDELGVDDPSSGGRATAHPATGAPEVPAFQAGADVPRSSVSGDVILCGLVVAAIVAASMFAAWAMVPTASSAPVPTSSLPSSAAAAWQVDGGEDALVAVGDGVVVVAGVDAIDAYAVDDGNLLWSRDFDRGGEPTGLAVYDEVAVTVEQTARTVATLSGFDTATGDLLWSRPGPFSVVALLPDAPVEYSSPAATTRLRVLDPQTGDVVDGDAEAVKLPVPERHVVGRRSGDLVLFDLRSGEWLEPTIGEFGLRSVAPVGGHLVALTDSSDIIVYDGDGIALDQRAFVSDVFGDFNGRAELVGGVPGTSIGIVSSGSSVGFDIAAGSIDVVWEVPGRVGTPVETARGPIAVARVVDASTGEVDHSLIDVTTGDTVVVTDVGVTHETPPRLAADGYIAAAAVGDPTGTIRAFDFDGVERWALPLEQGTEFELVDGTVFTTAPDGVITAYR